MKVHHDKQYIKQGSMTGADLVISWCGKTMIKGEEVLADPAAPPLPPLLPDAHCKRCLYAKRQEKGDSYMLAHGLPLVKRIRRTSDCVVRGWTLVFDTGTMESKEGES